MRKLRESLRSHIGRMAESDEIWKHIAVNNEINYTSLEWDLVDAFEIFQVSNPDYMLLAQKVILDSYIEHHRFTYKRFRLAVVSREEWLCGKYKTVRRVINRDNSVPYPIYITKEDSLKSIISKVKNLIDTYKLRGR